MVAIVVAVLALVISALTFYFSLLAPGKPELYAGESLLLGYYAAGWFYVSLPVSFVNTGTQTLTFKRVGLLVQTPGSQEGYLLEPRCYMRLEGGRFVQDSEPLPITIAGNKSVSKQVDFEASPDRPDEFKLLKSGTYGLTLLGWCKDSTHPTVSSSFSIVVSDGQTNLLEERRTKKDDNAIRVPQAAWRKWAAHFLTEVEVKALNKLDK